MSCLFTPEIAYRALSLFREKLPANPILIQTQERTCKAEIEVEVVAGEGLDPCIGPAMEALARMVVMPASAPELVLVFIDPKDPPDAYKGNSHINWMVFHDGDLGVSMSVTSPDWIRYRFSVWYGFVKMEGV